MSDVEFTDYVNPDFPANSVDASELPKASVRRWRVAFTCGLVADVTASGPLGAAAAARTSAMKAGPIGRVEYLGTFDIVTGERGNG